jgi:primosomal protein N' (replication factor Y)
VLLAESGLSLPDFRAAERTFQLLTQVAGRAGRGEMPGRVLAQTYDPEHPAVRFAAAHDVRGFYEAELEARRELGYPPFRRLVNLRVAAASEAAARRAAVLLAARAKERLARDPALAEQVTLVGPAPAPIARIRGRHRWHLLLKGRASGPVRRLAAALAADVGGRRGGLPAGATLALDVDPATLL